MGAKGKRGGASGPTAVGERRKTEGGGGLKGCDPPPHLGRGRHRKVPPRWRAYV
jgi:hypothetical protein